MMQTSNMRQIQTFVSNCSKTILSVFSSSQFKFSSNPIVSVVSIQLYYSTDQCWEKLLLKVMHYNIALFLKKLLITLLSYFGNTSFR